MTLTKTKYGFKAYSRGLGSTIHAVRVVGFRSGESMFVLYSGRATESLFKSKSALETVSRGMFSTTRKALIAAMVRHGVELAEKA